MKFHEYKIGDELAHGRISEIFSSGENFIICECNSDGYIAYQTIGYHGEWATPLNSVLAEIFSLIPEPKRRRKYLGRIANAFHDALMGNPDAGIKLLENVRDTILTKFKIRSRLSYLLGSLSVVFLNIFIALLMNSIFRSDLLNRAILIWNIVTFGSLGGSYLFLLLLKNYRLILKKIYIYPSSRA